MSEKFRVGLVQMSCASDPHENLARAELKIREAAAGGAHIVCLQELFRSRYFCREENADLFDLAESIPWPSTRPLGKLARDLKIVVIASLFERRAAGLYHNTAAVLDTSGEIAGLYRKIHIPADPLYFEKYYFTPGDLGFRNFDTPFGRISVIVMDELTKAPFDIGDFNRFHYLHSLEPPALNQQIPILARMLSNTLHDPDGRWSGVRNLRVAPPPTPGEPVPAVPSIFTTTGRFSPVRMQMYWQNRCSVREFHII
jgi:hypothetical protein